jgi:uncharacterized protein (TIGR01777 family)
VLRVVLAGGTGALGRRLAADFEARGDDVVILTRRPRPGGDHRQVVWDGVTVGPWGAELAGAVVVNLAGALVDRRPTPANIDLLTRSRVQPTQALARAAADLAEPPVVWVQMSTLAIYGDRGETVLDENAPPGDGPAQMAGVARAWEDAAREVSTGRQVVLRTGIVWAQGTPALRRLSGLVRWGLGGRVGTGRQWISWLHIDDYLAIVRRVVDDATLSGIVHAASPNPVRNAELMATLRQVLHRPPSPPTPAWLVPAGALAMRTDPALVLTGRRCVPSRLLAADFTFSYPLLAPALADLCGGRDPG